MAEWSIAAVLKTVERQLSGGSNPSLCATNRRVLWRPPALIEGMKNPRGSCEAACRRRFAEGSRLRETVKSLSLRHKQAGRLSRPALDIINKRIRARRSF